MSLEFDLGLVDFPACASSTILRRSLALFMKGIASSSCDVDDISVLTSVYEDRNFMDHCCGYYCFSLKLFAMRQG